MARWWTYVRDHQVRCPAGHALSTRSEIPEHGFIRCGDCTRWLFLLVVRGGHVIVAEVAPHERDAMQRLASPAAMIQYLEIFPRP